MKEKQKDEKRQAKNGLFKDELSKEKLSLRSRLLSALT